LQLLTKVLYRQHDGTDAEWQKASNAIFHNIPQTLQGAQAQGRIEPIAPISEQALPTTVDVGLQARLREHQLQRCDCFLC